MSSEKNGRVKAPSDITPVRYEPKTKYGREDFYADGSFRKRAAPRSGKNERPRAPSDITPARYEPKTKYDRGDYNADGTIRRRDASQNREHTPESRGNVRRTRGILSELDDLRSDWFFGVDFDDVLNLSLDDDSLDDPFGD